MTTNSVKCPQCGRVLSNGGEACLCGFRLSGESLEHIRVLGELKKEFESLSTIRDQLGRGLENISNQIEKYESLLFPSKEPERESFEEVRPADEQLSRKPEPDLPVKDKPEKRIFRKRPSGSFEVHLGQKVILAVGIIAMIFSIAFFLKYSFEQGWVDPLGRTLIAYGWGAAFIFAGEMFRRKNFRTFGLSLAGGGIAVLYAATFAAFQIYELIDQPVAFIMMVAVTVFGCFLSVIYDAKGLTVLSTLGGFLTPVLLSTGISNQTVLMSYMTVLNLGILGVAFFKRWGLLNAIGFVSTYILFTAWFADDYSSADFWPTVIFLNIFYFIYAIVPFAFHLAKPDGNRIGGLWIVMFNAFIAFGYSAYIISDSYSIEFAAIVSVVYAFTALVMADIIKKRETRESGAFTALAGLTSMFLIVTVPVLFSDHWITAFWAAEAMVLLVMSKKLGKITLGFGAWLLLAISVFKLISVDYPYYFRFSWDRLSVSGGYTHLLAPRLMTIAIVLTVVFLFGVFSRKYRKEGSGKSGYPAFTVFAALLFLFLNAEVSAFFSSYAVNARFASISVLWALFATALMALGFRKNISIVRKTSIALFLITLTKVFLYDISRISSIYRILSFFVLSIVLIGTSYLYWAFKDKIIQAVSEEKEKSS